MDENRRRFLQWAAAAPLIAVTAARVSGKDISPAPTPSAPACYDPATLPMAQKSLRKSLEYVDVSTDAAQRCGLCAFYQAKGDCGTCQILSAAVSPGAYCSSFALKAG